MKRATGVHDLCGKEGFGPILRETDEPVFHEEWERRMFALMMATFAGGNYNLDAFRFAIERMEPKEYLESSYYAHWLFAVELLLVEGGLLTWEELRARRAKIAKEEDGCRS